MKAHPLNQPFGEESCENEIECFKNNYPTYYFDEAPFNSVAMDTKTYLIVGRRGSGKSSLAEYFSFQPILKKADSITIESPDKYERILTIVEQSLHSTQKMNCRGVSKIWEYLIWSRIFHEYRDKDAKINTASPFGTNPLQKLMEAQGEDIRETIGYIEQQVIDQSFENAKKEIFKITQKTPIIVAIDTLERYDIENESMMMTTAALVECASNFNRLFSGKGVHLKAFLSAEIFPHIRETAISNTSKFIKNELYLQWRSKDLMRLVCWRLYNYLKQMSTRGQIFKNEINWRKHGEVCERIWTPNFGDALENDFGLKERTFPYVLRHTQMRPRQLVILCNQIAEYSRRMKKFPKMVNHLITEAINHGQRLLSAEVLNSYAKIHPNVANITTALVELPMRFKGNELDRVAPCTAGEWPDRSYTPGKFKRLVAELGIVGVVRAWDKKTKIVEADFEYNLNDRLTIISSDMCVIHPMFYSKLRTRTEEGIIVYPFPGHFSRWWDEI